MGISYTDEGKVAAGAGLSEEHNPYEQGTDAAREWASGFASASGPSDSDAFQEGLDAYGRGMSREDCPHPAESDEREEWEDGWDEAKHYDTDEEVKDNL